MSTVSCSLPIVALLLFASSFICRGDLQQQYIGCYEDGDLHNRSMGTPTGNEKQTLELCYKQCLVDSNYAYFGVESWYYCHCADSYDSIGALDESRCNTPCVGNRTQTCGGDHALSVYTVCPAGFGGSRCGKNCGNCRNNMCFRNETCVAGCDDGWQNIKCRLDINECGINKGGCHHQCNNTIGSYFCYCDGGFNLQDDQKTCEDINECEDGNKGGCNQDCNNTFGSYFCSCNGGFQLEEDHRTCVAHFVYYDSHHQCNNTIGSYFCYCDGGFNLQDDQKTFEDINECEDGNKGGCNQDCNNTFGSYFCSCNGGFQLEEDHRTCVDINECEDSNKGGCNHICNNTIGSYLCSCNGGFQLEEDLRTCVDINECDINNGGCHHQCNNTIGSYFCYCDAGFNLQDDKQTCVDINECEDGNKGGCNDICTNTIGSYFCSCNRGFQLKEDKRTCVDINECLINKGGCHLQCNNTIGSYFCYCDGGFNLQDDQKTCEDIDECLVNNGHCEQHCLNLEPWRECYCNFGYTAVGTECKETKLLVIVPVISVIAALVVVGVIVAVVIRFRISIRRKFFPAKNSGVAKVSYPNRSVSVCSDDEEMNVDISNCVKPTVDSDDFLQESALHESSPIYENISDIETSKSLTRVPVTSLTVVVDRILRMPDALKEEFKVLPMQSSSKFDFAQKVELKTKNRFKNILPYDDNRVKLSVINNDPLTTYINASFIKGYQDHEKIIASHGPTVTTLNDFWRMIWEYNVGVIVMVTKCQEEMKMKCEQYWPESKPSMSFQKVNVLLVSTVKRPDYVVRKFTVSSEDGETSRSLTHFQYTEWPDHGVPRNAISLLTIQHAVRQILAHHQYIVVHCSAGVGRTGSYLAIEYLLQQARCEGFVDVNKYVRDLRHQRMHSVQTLDQYGFIFKSLHEALVLGDTCKSLSEFSDHVSELKSVNKMTNTFVIKSEFQMLQKMSPPASMDLCLDANNDQNKRKNRNVNLLPTDGKRVFLKTVQTARTDYINAVFVPSFYTKNKYISTQLPLKETVVDFWNMCIDFNCKVIVFLGAEDTLTFLPQTGDDCLSLGDVCVSNIRHSAVRENECLDVLTVTAQRGNGSAQHEAIYANTTGLSDDRQVVVVQVTLCESQAAVRDALIFTYLYVQNLMDKSETDNPVVVMSSDGVENCGMFIAVSNLCNMISDQAEVDVFQITHNVKDSQPHFFTNLIDYENVYLIADEYAKQISITTLEQ